MTAAPRSSRKTLALVMGSTAAAAALTADLTRWEGKVNVGYVDIAGIPTKCFGDTKDVQVGKFYSDAHCEVSLQRQAVVHVEGVLKCTPGLAERPQQLRAAGSAAYNIGLGAYCTSTAARRFNAGDWRGGCEALGPSFTVGRADGQTVTVGGFVNIRRNGKLVRVQGLVNRRTYERAVCLQGLD